MHSTRYNRRWRCVAVLLMLLPAAAVSGCVGGLHHQRRTDSRSLVGLARGAGWQPGLTVVYMSGKFRHTNEMPSGDSIRQLGHPGAPILQFNHRFGLGEVFASGRARGIGLEAAGFIHLEHPGIYRFKALANDGIRVWIADRLVVDDGEWHDSGDRFSEPRAFDNPQSGWAAIRLRYFQRKGTATLKLLWQPPGQDDFKVIPAAAYAHGPPTG
ncbi:MAG: PA14 domain-containing protein [Desulfosarcinaceae bacterium]|jgi:hypothetical protein